MTQNYRSTIISCRWLSSRNSPPPPPPQYSSCRRCRLSLAPDNSSTQGAPPQAPHQPRHRTAVLITLLLIPRQTPAAGVAVMLINWSLILGCPTADQHICPPPLNFPYGSLSRCFVHALSLFLSLPQMSSNPSPRYTKLGREG